jgi:branched-chain amino acid transport system ATP-binding protein
MAVDPGQPGRPDAEGRGAVNGEALLRVEELSVSYGRIVALQATSFTVPRGALVLVLGPNGAGKTTLVKALAGAVTPRSGRVWLDRDDVTWVPAYQRVRRGMALVPEGRGTLRGLSVRDNLDLGWHSAPPARRSDHRDSIERILELVPALRERLEQDCSTLSGGEMQMLAIARALLAKPRVLLLDEPSLGLAPRAIERVYDSLIRLNAEGLAMVLVEQKAMPVEWVPATTIVLQAGRVVYQRYNEKPTEEELAALYLGQMAG